MGSGTGGFTENKKTLGLKGACVHLPRLTVCPRPEQWTQSDKRNTDRERGRDEGDKARETLTDSMQMERCRPGKSLHSWCRTGNDTRLRKPSTMTVHWSFFNIDRLCFCGNKIVCVFGHRYKWQRFPCSMKTSRYLHSASSTHDCHALSCLALGQDISPERNAADMAEIKQWLKIYIYSRAWKDLQRWCSEEGSGGILQPVSMQKLLKTNYKTHNFHCGAKYFYEPLKS